MEKIKYFLVLERRLGDYNIIDISKLDICDIYVNNDISSIDMFTSRFTESEIRESIERSNMVREGYLNSPLKIISDVKHNLRIVTKDVLNKVVDFQNNPEEIDQNFKNKLFGLYRKIVEQIFQDNDLKKELIEHFKIVLRENDKREIFSSIEELPYYKTRTIYLDIYDEVLRKEQEKLRKLTKLDDVA